MNEEEAIEYIEQFIGIKKEYKCKPIKVKTLNNTREAIETVLNLLEKKDREIERVSSEFAIGKKQYEELIDDYEKLNLKSIEKQKEIEKKDKQLEQYQNMLATNDMLHVLECEKKDKMIDEMAECIDIELSSSRLGIILNKNVKPLESYKKDIKQYFERKVEG